MAERNAGTGDDAITFRIGVHLGDVIVEGEDIFGDGVNIAARLQEIGEPGGVTISSNAHDSVEGRIEAVFVDAGEQELKNIARPVKVWRWSLATISSMGIQTPRTGHTLQLPDKPSIAVLPFDNMSGDPEQEYFADGIAEDILTTLSKIRHLFVIARNSSFTYKGHSVDVRQVGQELGVQYVLEGSVRKAGNQVRVSAQLIDCSDGHHLWADHFDGGLNDVFALQDRITQDIVIALEVELTEGEVVRIWRKRSGNPLAYEAFHKARDYHLQFTRGASALGIAEAKRAIEINPEYWDAWLMLGYITNMRARFGWSDDPEASLKQSEDCARRVLDADDTISDAHCLAGSIALSRGDYDNVVKYGKQSVALGPNHPDCHHVLAITYCFAGLPEEAVGLERHALRLNPLNPTNSLVDLGRAYFQLGRYEEAQNVLLDVVSRRPLWMNARALLTATYQKIGNADEARAQAKEITRIRPSFRIGRWAKMQPYRDARDIEAILEPMRNAGLPE